MSPVLTDQSFSKEINYVILILQKEVIAAMLSKLCLKYICWFYNLNSDQNGKIIKFESENPQFPFIWYIFCSILTSNSLIIYFVELCWLCKENDTAYFFNTNIHMRVQAMRVHVSYFASVYARLHLTVKYRSLTAQKLNFRLQVVHLLIFNLW